MNNQNPMIVDGEKSNSNRRSGRNSDRTTIDYASYDKDLDNKLKEWSSNVGNRVKRKKSSKRVLNNPDTNTINTAVNIRET